MWILQTKRQIEIYKNTEIVSSSILDNLSQVLDVYEGNYDIVNFSDVNREMLQGEEKDPNLDYLLEEGKKNILLDKNNTPIELVSNTMQYLEILLEQATMLVVIQVLGL